MPANRKWTIPKCYFVFVLFICFMYLGRMCFSPSPKKDDDAGRQWIGSLKTPIFFSSIRCENRFFAIEPRHSQPLMRYSCFVPCGAVEQILKCYEAFSTELCLFTINTFNELCLPALTLDRVALLRVSCRRLKSQKDRSFINKGIPQLLDDETWSDATDEAPNHYSAKPGLAYRLFFNSHFQTDCLARVTWLTSVTCLRKVLRHDTGQAVISRAGNAAWRLHFAMS